MAECLLRAFGVSALFGLSPKADNCVGSRRRSIFAGGSKADNCVFPGTLFFSGGTNYLAFLRSGSTRGLGFLC